MLKTRWHNILIILAALGIVKINFALLSLAQYLIVLFVIIVNRYNL